MTREQIELELLKSTRWGDNQQPVLGIVLEWLTEHDWPVSSIQVDDDMLLIQLTRPFTVEQAVELGRWLRPDEFTDCGGGSYRLWWD